MRRILRKIAENDLCNLGDTTTLADPAVVDDLVARPRGDPAQGRHPGARRPEGLRPGELERAPDPTHRRGGRRALIGTSKRSELYAFVRRLGDVAATDVARGRPARAGCAARSASRRAQADPVPGRPSDDRSGVRSPRGGAALASPAGKGAGDVSGRATRGARRPGEERRRVSCRSCRPALRAVEAALHGLARRDLSERAAKVSASLSRRRGPRRSPSRPRADAPGLCAGPAAERPTRPAPRVRRGPAAGARLRARLAAGRRRRSAAAAAGRRWRAWPALIGIAAGRQHPVPEAGRAASAGGRRRRATPARRAATAASRPEPADLVLASYALAEIAPARQAEVAKRSGPPAEAMLTLVEPGTPAGFDASAPPARADRRRRRRWRPARARRRLLRSSRPTGATSSSAAALARASSLAKARRPVRGREVRLLGRDAPGVATRRARCGALAPPRGEAGDRAQAVQVDGVIERRLAAKRDKAAYAVATTTAIGATRLGRHFLVAHLGAAEGRTWDQRPTCGTPDSLSPDGATRAPRTTTRRVRPCHQASPVYGQRLAEDPGLESSSLRKSRPFLEVAQQVGVGDRVGARDVGAPHQALGAKGVVELLDGVADVGERVGFRGVPSAGDETFTEKFGVWRSAERGVGRKGLDALGAERRGARR